MQLGAWKSSDEEKRHLRLKVSSLEKAVEAHRKARRKLEQENRELAINLKEALKEIKQLKEENDKLQRQRDRFRDMVFRGVVWVSIFCCMFYFRNIFPGAAGR